jgi:hypothetical protein
LLHFLFLIITRTKKNNKKTNKNTRKTDFSLVFGAIEIKNISEKGKTYQLLSKRKQKQNHMTWLQLQKHNDCYVMKEI